MFFRKPDHSQEIILLKWNIEEAFREGNFSLTKELVSTLSKNYRKELQKRLVPLDWHFTDSEGKDYTTKEAMDLLNNINTEVTKIC